MKVTKLPSINQQSSPNILAQEQLIRQIRKEFDTTDQLFTELKKKKIRIKDLESKTLNDFGDDQSGNKIKEARYVYFQTRKKVKLQQLKEVVEERRRKRTINDAIQIDLMNKGYGNNDVLNSRRLRVDSTYTNLDQFNSPSPLFKQVSLTSNTLDKSKAFITMAGNQSALQINNSMSPIISARLQKQPSALNLSELVVNQEPEIPLKVDVNYKVPEMFLNQKQHNLEKMTHAKDKLEGQMNIDAQQFELKLKDQKVKYRKIKEIIEYEDYERIQKINIDEDKRQRALKKFEKINKEIEKKQYQEYKEYMDGVRKQKEEKDHEHLQNTIHKTKEILEIKLKQDKLQQQIEEQKKRQNEEIENHLNSLEQKLHQKSVIQSEKLNTVKKSRNYYSQRINQARTDLQQKMTEDQISKLLQEISRFSVLADKRDRVSYERREFSENLQKFNQERLEKKKQAQQQIQKEREKWSYSILQKHKKQWDQVIQRNYSLDEKVRVKKEFQILKRDDQNLNYQDIVEDQRKKQEQIQSKHKSLNTSIQTYKKKMDELQQSQRLTEVQKKIELYNDYWCQTLKPKNKLIDISFRKQILQQDPIIRSRAPIINIKLTKTDDEQ